MTGQAGGQTPGGQAQGGNAGGAGAAPGGGARDAGAGLGGAAGGAKSAGAGLGAGPGGAARLAGLERRYRRLLAWYPRGHRAEHAEEMLGVLMAAAQPGQARPGAREAADLVAGALRIRLRRVACCFGAPRWQDALAVVSVLAPLLLVTLLSESLDPRALYFYATSGALFHSPVAWWLPYEPGQFLLLAGWVTVTALALRRRRRVAVAAAAVTLMWQLLLWAGFGIGFRNASFWWLDAVHAPEEIFLGTLALAALACSAGPGRGLAILGRRRAWLIAAGLAAWGAAHQLAVGWLTTADVWFHAPATILVTRYTSLAAVAVGIPAAVLCLRSPAGRRVLLLTVPVVSPNGVLYLTKRMYRAAPFPAGWLLPNETVWVLYLSLAIVVAALAGAGRGRPGAAGLAGG